MLETIFEAIVWIAIITNTVTQVKWYIEDKKKRDYLKEISYSAFNIQKNTWRKK